MPSKSRPVAAFVLLLVLLSDFVLPACSFSASPRSAAYAFSNSNSDDGGPRSAVPMNTPARQSLPEHLRLEAIPGKGLGVMTCVPISVGTVVGDYEGEVMTAEEKDRRYLPSKSHLQQPVDHAWRQSRVDRQQTVTGTYLYGVVTPNGPSIYIDAEDEHKSLWTRFVNHASPPAANINPKSIHESWNGKPRVWFVANRNIEVGEELCFDYGDDYWLPEDEVVA